MNTNSIVFDHIFKYNSTILLQDSLYVNDFYKCYIKQISLNDLSKFVLYCNDIYQENACIGDDVKSFNIIAKNYIKDYINLNFNNKKLTEIEDLAYNLANFSSSKDYDFIHNINRKIFIRRCMNIISLLHGNYNYNYNYNYVIENIISLLEITSDMVYDFAFLFKNDKTILLKNINFYLKVLLRKTKQFNIKIHNNANYEKILKKIIKNDVDRLELVDWNMITDIMQEEYNIIHEFDYSDIFSRRCLIELLRREYE